MPRLKPVSGWVFGPTKIIAREGYVLQHSSTDKVAIWVCERLDKDQLSGTAERNDKFLADPKLDIGKRAEKEDYKYSGYDTGHMHPAANQLKSQKLNDETFYLSNMAPQLAGLNRGIWRRLENKCRKLINDGSFESLHIISGGFFYDREEENAATADGLINYDQIGTNLVSVPTHFFKVVIGKKSGKWEATGFVVEHKKYPSGYDLSRLIEPIDWIEARAFIDIMPKLNRLEAQRLESKKGTLWP